MTDLGNTGRTGIDTWAKRGTMLHCAVFLANRPPLSTETFRLVSFSGQETVSQPFQFQLELHANTDPDGKDPVRFEDTAYEKLTFAELIGRPVSVGIDEPDPGTEQQREQRWADAIAGRPLAHLSVFNGIVTSFSMGAPGVYHLTMQPALWRLSLTNAYRVHHGMSIVDAIGGLLKAHKVEHSLAAVSGPGNPAVTRVQDWLQAGESDFDFIQRLMAKANIYYYFEHTATSHKVVFANRPNYPDAYEDGRLLRYTHTSAEALGQEQDDVITDYRYSQSLVSSGVTGSLVRQEAAWEQDSVADVQTYRASSAPDLGELPFHRYQVCQYGGCNDEAAWETSRVSESLATSATELSGSSHCVRFRCGYQFRLASEEFSGRGIRTALADSPFVLTQVQHQADVGGGYSNQFKATEADGLITPFSLHDTQQGGVLAQVVAHENGTSPKDWRYYQKINFDPEQESVSQSQKGCDENLRAKGVYVRFVTDAVGTTPVWIKLAAHMQTVPEIGVIVQVSRANDLTELPEIQSIVQNNGNRVVTPSGWTANTNVGSNYSTSYGDSKSVRFGLSSVADLDGAVGKITPKYDTGLYRDVSYSQGGSYSYSTAEGGRSGMLSDSESFGSTYSNHHGAESKSWSDIGYSYSKQKIGSTDSFTTIDGRSYSESTIGESESHSTIKGNQFSDSTIQGMSVSINKVVGHSASTTTLSTSSNDSTAVLQASSSLTGMESRTSIVGMSTGLSATGVSLSSGVTGMSTSSNAVGINVSSSATGVHSGDSLTGLSDSTNITGSSSQLNVTGSSMNLSSGGASVDITNIGSSNRVTNYGSAASVEVVGGEIKAASVPGRTEAELVGTKASLMSAIRLIM